MIVVHVAVAVLLCLKRRLLGASSTGEIARILQNVGQHSILLKQHHNVLETEIKNPRLTFVS